MATTKRTGKYPRYQVLYAATPPDTGSRHSDAGTMSEARRIAAELRKRGERNVSIWDTQNNPISNMFR